MKKSFGLLLGIVGSIIIFAGCGAQTRKITVVLDWTPNTNHTGLFAAVNEGYFQQEGLEVEIIEPVEGAVEQLVSAGTAQFGVTYQESVTFARAQEVPVVSLAAVIQHNTSGFASLKEKNITAPKDFEGKKYGGWGSPIEEATLRYLMQQDGADPDKLQIVTTGEADFFQASASGEIDYAWIFEGWAGIEARLSGMELNYIDLGKVAEVFDYYTPVLITSEKNIEENRDMVEKFMRAAEKGYQFAIKNPDAAAEILMDHAPELDRSLVMESQRYLADKYQADASYWGMQKQEVWERYMNWLYENDFITEKIDVTKAFTNEFLSK